MDIVARAARNTTTARLKARHSTYGRLLSVGGAQFYGFFEVDSVVSVCRGRVCGGRWWCLDEIAALCYTSVTQWLCMTVAWRCYRAAVLAVFFVVIFSVMFFSHFPSCGIAII